MQSIPKLTALQTRNIMSHNVLLQYMTNLEHLTFLVAAGITPTTPLVVMRWGYLLGCITQLLRKNGIDFYWSENVSIMTLEKVQWIVQGKLTSDLTCIISFGFSIGFLQEYFEESEKKWWKPVTRHLKSDKIDFEKVKEITLTNMPSFVQLSHLFYLDNVLNVNGPIDWLQMGKKIISENEKVKRILWYEHNEISTGQEQPKRSKL